MRALGWLVVLGSSCATVVPLQTASVVAPGTWRVGGQAGAAFFCGTPEGSIFACNQFPDGVPLPELRANARRGLGWSSDVGASLQVAGQIDAPQYPMQLGLTFDAKRELIHVSSGAFQQVVSLGLLAGGAVAWRPTLTPGAQFEWGLPLFYGLQTAHFEWVAGVSFSQRLQWFGAFELSHRVGASVGVFRRDPTGFGVQVAYLTDVRIPTHGAIQLQVGWLWDLQ